MEYTTKNVVKQSKRTKKGGSKFGKKERKHSSQRKEKNRLGALSDVVSFHCVFRDICFLSVCEKYLSGIYNYWSPRESGAMGRAYEFWTIVRAK